MDAPISFGGVCMRIETVLTLKLEEDEAERLNPLADDLVGGARFSGGSYQVRFHHAADAARKFMGLLEELEIGFGLHEERSFSANEIERAPALHVARTSPLVVGPEKTGVCSHRVATQPDADDSKPADLESVAGGLARTGSGSYMVDESLASVLIKEHISGCLLRPHRSSKGAFTRWFEMVPIHRLPPMHSPPTRFVHEPEGACPECGQGGLFLHSLPFYDVAVDALTDVNVSFESFGAGSEISPELVVSQKLFRVLRDNGVEDLMVEPVLFV
jgi:hypothetical protein